MVKNVESMGEWAELMEQSKEKLVVVFFEASWVGPCRMIAPYFGILSNENPHCIFVKVDTDAHSDIVQMCGIRAMPTFHFYKDAKKVDEMTGANTGELKNKVATLA